MRRPFDLRYFRPIMRLALVVLLGAGLSPATVAAPAQAAMHRSAAADKPPTLAELQSRAKKIAAQAGRARKAADAAEIAAANARANLRLAESNLAAVRNGTGAHARQLQLPAPQQNYAVAQAQAQLQQAQQAAQQAQLNANLSNLSQPPAGAKGLTPILGNVNQSTLLNAQSAVIAAQQRLTAAQQSQAMSNQQAALADNFDNAGLANATQNAETARQLADKAERAARAAELNAEALAEDADRACAAVRAAQGHS